MSDVRQPNIRRGPRPLLNRADLDRAGPWLRLFAGLFLLVWSTYTTIVGIGIDFAPLLIGTIYGIPVAIIAGLAAAALLSFGEWLTSETVPLVYSALLVVDARYTQWQISPWIDTLSAYHLKGTSAILIAVVSFLVSWGMSLAIARYGEILLFGRRR